MKMHILDCGSVLVDETSLVAGANRASYRNQEPKARYLKIPVCVCLIETPNGPLLYDTGCHESKAIIPPDADPRSPFVYESPDQLLPAHLERLGLKPSDIRYVAISHLHSDHCGYLYLFDKAEVYLSDAEFTMSMRAYGMRGFTGPYKYDDFDRFLDARLNWRLIPNDVFEKKLCPGVSLFNFGSGHAFGMTGMIVELPNSGPFLLCADALYGPVNLGPPVALPGILYDSLGYIRTADRIRELAVERGAKIVFGHDTEQFRSMLNTESGFFD